MKKKADKPISAEEKRTEWLNARRRAWLHDHPDKLETAYDYAGSFTDTPEGQKAFAKWHANWMAREGKAIKRTF